jgi:hypothetical protein
VEKPARKAVGSRHTYIETHVQTKGTIKKDREGQDKDKSHNSTEGIMKNAPEQWGRNTSW